MALTIDQRTSLQMDLGIEADQAIFSDYEMDQAYTRASGDMQGALVYLYRQLVSNPRKLKAYFGEGFTESERKTMLTTMYARLHDMEKAARITNPVLQATTVFMPRGYGDPTVDYNGDGVIDEQDWQA